MINYKWSVDYWSKTYMKVSYEHVYMMSSTVLTLHFK